MPLKRRLEKVIASLVAPPPTLPGVRPILLTPVKQISVVGGDFPKEDLAALAEARGADLEGVQVKEGRKVVFLERQIPHGHEHARYPGNATECAGRL